MVNFVVDHQFHVTILLVLTVLVYIVHALTICFGMDLFVVGFLLKEILASFKS